MSLIKPILLSMLTAVACGLLSSLSADPPEHPERESSGILPWALRPIGMPTPPQAVATSGWARNPIDHFILAKLQADDLEPSAEADRRTLIRRLSFDLLGLPPSPSEVERFLLDPRDDAYEQLVDRLLASPRYGERQARLWLDLVRYADSDGYKADVYRPHSWRYRDYVIRSFNADKTYDRFIHEQLAGDELFPEDADALIATGYLRQWPYEDNQIDVLRQWHAILEDITEVTADVFLATGMKCAKCHDHKFDPIPQRDYYRLQSFFAGIVLRDDATLNPPAVLARFKKASAGWERTAAALTGQIEALSQPALEARERMVYRMFPDYLKAIWDKPPDQRTPLERQLREMADYQVRQRGGELKHTKETGIAIKGLEGTLEILATQLGRPEPPPDISGVTDLGPEVPLVRIPGDASQEPIAPGVLSLLDPSEAEILPIPGNPRSSGRRAALARWLTDRENPLTSRVMVNRLWQQHFGHGLVRTPNDFGKQGEEPSHPDLLDWLARSFTDEHGGSLKGLHRLMVTSATYRQSSMRSRGALERDPENRLLAGVPMRRLDAEQLRDSMLAVAGELQHTATGGEAVPDDSPRRSVYVKNIRNQQSELLKTFDAADMFNSCADRKTTTTPLQSLLLMNGSWLAQRAEAFAALALREAGGDLPSAIELAYQRAFARRPTERESSAALTFLQSPDGRNQPEAMADFCHVLLNANEFLFLD